ncbi:MAG: response regulator transcription factor [Vampirovibrio sp.]|nr:response regulator transcription factor [Vampirovibrio sp.]
MNILVVDDEPDAVCDLLTFHGYNVDVAVNGYQGLEILNQDKEKYDLVILDIVMPGLDGIGVLKTIREDPYICRLPIIMLTSKTTQQNTVEGLSKGADVYLTKPYESSVMLAYIESLGRRAMWQHQTIKKEYKWSGHYQNKYPQDLLSPREKEILKYIIEGKSNKYIGEKLFITERTVKTHVMNIRKKLNAENRAHAASIALNHNLLVS